MPTSTCAHRSRNSIPFSASPFFTMMRMSVASVSTLPLPPVQYSLGNVPPCQATPRDCPDHAPRPALAPGPRAQVTRLGGGVRGAVRHRLALAVLVLLEAAALAAAWWRIPVPAPIDWGDPLGWLHHTDPETATLVVGRLLAIVVAGWLLASTLLAVVAAAAAGAVRLPRHLRALLTLGGRAAPGAVRHLAQAAIAVSLVAATARPAVAAPATHAPPPARARRGPTPRGSAGPHP